MPWIFVLYFVWVTVKAVMCDGKLDAAPELSDHAAQQQQRNLAGANQQLAGAQRALSSTVFAVHQEDASHKTSPSRHS